MKKKTKTDRIVKTVLGGAAGGAITQVVKGTIMKGKKTLYTDLAAIAIGAIAPSLVKMDGIGELGAGMIGAGVAGVIASSVPSLAGTVRMRLIAKALLARVKKKIKTAS